MPTQNTWFPETAFDGGSEQKSVVPLQTQQNAVAYLRTVLNDDCRIRILIGENQSGKTTIVRQFVAGLRSDIAAAIVVGSGVTPDMLLSEALVKFGYRTDLRSADDLLRMLNIFAVQQSGAGHAPVLVVENIDEMQPAALRALCLIAKLTHQGRFAVRLVLTGAHRSRRLLESKGMTAISERLESVHDIEPLTRHEATLYLQGRLAASGISQPETVLPMNVCDKVHDLSGGRPGAINEVALRTLEQSLTFPASEADVLKQDELRKTAHSTPRLILSLNGETLKEYVFKDSKLTIGRSSLADVVLNNEYASKFHVLLLRYPDSLVLADLNSSNGTFVNSVKVDSTLLKSDDIVSVATYRIKILDAPQVEEGRTVDSIQDTATMKTLDDMREQRNSQKPVIDTQKKSGR